MIGAALSNMLKQKLYLKLYLFLETFPRALSRLSCELLSMLTCCLILSKVFAPRFVQPQLIMAADGFIMTIDSDSDEPSHPLPKSRKGKSEILEVGEALNPEFSFDLSGDPYMDFIASKNGPQDFVKTGSRPVCLFLLMSWVNLIL